MMMNIKNSEIRKELLEALYDLKHDLGKYIRLPVAMLSREASPNDLDRALSRALFETRKGPAGVLSAEQIFTAFADEWGPSCAQFSAYGIITRAVDRALALRNTVETMEHVEIMNVLGDVGAAIQLLIQEVERDDPE